MISIPANRPAVVLRPIAAAAVAALIGLGLAIPAAAADGEPDLLTVRFDLVPPTNGSDDDPLSPAGPSEVAHYAEFQVDHGGVTRRLRPLGSVRASAVETALATSAEIDGLRIGSAADGFEATLSDAFSSPSLGAFARIDTGGVGEPAVIDLALPRALEPGDFLLVQEAGGDDEVEIEAVGPDGSVIGPARTLGSPYRWNSGQATADGAIQWASIVDVSPWSAAGTVNTLRVRATKADVKILVLEPAVGAVEAPLAEDAGTEAASAAPAQTSPTTEVPPTDAAPSTTAPPAPTSSTESIAPVEADLASDARNAPGTQTPVAESGSDATSSATDPTPGAAPTTAVPPSEPAEVPTSNPATLALALTPTAAPTALAMTGPASEPWVLVALATGLIFFGYTTVAAFRRPTHRPEPGESSGHAQLDALGFD